MTVEDDGLLTPDIAAATMTIGIIAFLERTQVFFVAQRLVWAMIMIAIGMTMSKCSFCGLDAPSAVILMSPPVQHPDSPSSASYAASAGLLLPWSAP